MVMRKKWGDLSSRNRRLTTVVGVVEVILLAAALFDIKRRPAGQINGPKWMWTSFAFVTFIGPIAYFTFGRRRGASD